MAAETGTVHPGILRSDDDQGRVRGRLRRGAPLFAASVFLASALAKIVAPGRPIPPEAFSSGPWIAPYARGAEWAIAAGEILLALGLLRERTRPFAVRASLAFLVAATAFLVWLLLVGVDPVLCGCFGRLRVGVGVHFFLLAALLAALEVLRDGASRSPFA